MQDIKGLLFKESTEYKSRNLSSLMYEIQGLKCYKSQDSLQ
jgi:hypothetical protein